MIDGFERMPFISSPGTRPTTRPRCEEAGLEKAVDLFMYELVISDRSKILPVVFKLAERVEPRHGITIRRMSRRSLRRDLDRFAEVYNEAWSENWGFVPYSERDLDVYAQEMQLVFDRNWFMVAETADGETAAIALTVPDINQVLVKMKGRLLPFGWLHYPAQEVDHRPGSSRVPRRQARLPAHGGRGGAVRRALRHRLAHAAEVGRDGLDPRDQPQHEPRHGGDGRPRRAAFPGLRTRFVRLPLWTARDFLKASPPMFKSGLLDKFTRVHHVVPVVIFGPAIAILFAFGVDRVGLLAGARRTRSAATSSGRWPSTGSTA